VEDVSALFQMVKLALLTGTGLGKDALHIHFGLAIFLAVRLIWRGRHGWWAAWSAALAATLGGEWLDIEGEALRGALQPDSAHWHDVWNTMVWPTVLALTGTWLYPPRGGDQPTSAPSAEANNRAPS
jgi:hypothetical protein